MKRKRILDLAAIWLLAMIANIPIATAQRSGRLPANALSNRLLISNGPKGPIMGGESAVTDMVLLNDGWVYGSTKATWGAKNCHLFRTNGEKIEHILNLTSRIAEQTTISDIAIYGKGNSLIGCTSAYDATLDDKSKTYEGGHLFSFDPAASRLEDFGIIARGQGINCIVIDSIHAKIYGITYPSGHLFSFDIKSKSVKDFGEVMTPWRVKDLGRVSWRGVPKVLMIDDQGSLYFSTYYRTEIEMAKQELMKGGMSSYSSLQGGRIYRLAYGEEKPVFTGLVIPTQTGMDSDPLYENGIASAFSANDGGFWCGTINDGFLFKFDPSSSAVINKGKAFQYWNLKSLAYGGDGKLYMLGGRDEDNSWLMTYDPKAGSLECLGWPENTAQCSVICADSKGRIIIAENLRHSFIWVFDPNKIKK